MAIEQLNMFGPAEEVDTAKIKGRCDWTPAPWERENLWPARLSSELGQDTCEILWGDVPRHTRLQVEQVCRRLALDSNTVYRLIQQGEFDTVDVGAGSTNPTYRIYRYSVIWFLFRREFVACDVPTRPAALAQLTAAQAAKLEQLAAAVRRSGRCQ